MPDTTAPLAPMTPHAAISAFSYLRAVQAGDVEAAREFAGTEPRMAELLVGVVEQLVDVVTALPDPEAGEPSTETFALEALGRVLVASSRRWAQAGPDAADGIARSVVDFVVQFLTDDHEDVAEVLRQLEAVGVGQAIAAHPAPAGSHPVRRSIV
ncbi:hypothetical protein PV721_28065 [Streptomyces sp. MB09-01]|uniref:hypothetical protein n=1 Tax=Streptomyces sp. MB09-01 TaxID=3028666 RepID=UPI0029A23CD8|nr:hypothetical protein [Streptomyces sp. MB09-01]MDX3538134.1 hypothetical protein [Streptomyces sp. MB09-01]